MADALHAPRYDWHHKTPLHYSLYPRKQYTQGHDWGSIRRGRQIYTEVFAPCHSLDMLAFRHLQEFMSIEEVKELAADCEVPGEPNPTTGDIEDRPAVLLDKVPQPYKNAVAAKAMNNGAAPPDLTLITKGRDGGENYVFSLLTSYDRPVPAGIQSPGGVLCWNPYFNGCWIAMPKPLSDDQVEYEDGTPASVSQMSKDVCCFLAWCAEPWMDERKYTFIKGAITVASLMPFAYCWYKTRYNVVKYRRIRASKRGSL